jgi:tRNA (guanine37-N1)-methyltransferase
MSNVWQATVLTIFPEMFPGVLDHSLIGKARTENKWALQVANIRDYATDKHASVDDTPYGGGAGMVMRADVVSAAIEANHRTGDELIYLSPRGEPLTQSLVRELAAKPGVTLLCGRYEGVDQRVLDHHKIREISLGDFVLMGGEVAAQAVIEAVVRLLPDVIGKAESHEKDSFEDGLLEHPHYTKPQEWQGLSVPEVLISGHHKNIEDWKRAQAKDITRKKRPDLWEKYVDKD